uniref:Uncharacterized protein n=1 Tax=Hyaloperonospora arabidopsidis (strain Emoy2) TaxID=559515 RepID=M4BQ97_HYAAE
MYCPGETFRHFYARVSTKFQDNTVTSLGGKTPHGMFALRHSPMRWQMDGNLLCFVISLIST